MEAMFDQVGVIITAILQNITNPDAWKEVLSRPEVWVSAFVALNLIVFTETGLFFGFFLPGDSLLVTAGIVAQVSDWNVLLLISTLCVSAIVGDTVGYWIGAKAGPAIFRRPDSRFFKRGHLLAAKEFYDRHGGKTIIIARFMPFIRTFAPVVAGAAKMEYRTFLFYNVIGGLLWVVSMIMFGYTLHLWADALLKPVFGEEFRIEKHIDKVVILIVLLSVAPIFWKGFTEWRKRGKKAGAVTPLGEITESMDEETTKLNDKTVTPTV